MYNIVLENIKSGIEYIQKIQGDDYERSELKLPQAKTLMELTYGPNLEPKPETPKQGQPIQLSLFDNPDSESSHLNPDGSLKR